MVMIRGKRQRKFISQGDGEFAPSLQHNISSASLPLKFSDHLIHSNGRPSSSHSHIPLNGDAEFMESDSDADEASSTPPGMSEKTTKNGRGRTKMLKSWGNEKFEVQINDLNQAIGENAAKLSSQMGRVAKNGSRFPLTVTDWRKIDKYNKEITWLEYKTNFSLEDNFKHQFLKKLGVMWKNWKSEEMSLKNASNRGNQKVPHRTGKKSYAVVRNEMQMENGEDPTNYDFWMATHVGFAKSTLDKKTSKFIGKLKQLVSRNPEALKNKDVKDQLLAKFLGPEKPGQMRKYGFGPTPNQVNAIKNQKKLVEEKVSVLVDSIRKELKEEIQSDLRVVIEEIVRDIIRSQTRKNSLAQESSEFLAPSVARQDIGVPEPNLVPESSNTPVNREDAHVESHAPSESSIRPQVQETDARIQQSSANKDKLKKRKLYGNTLYGTLEQGCACY